MTIIAPSFSLQAFDRKVMLAAIEAAGRTCYRSDDRITPDTAAAFVRQVVQRGHESVIEHVGITVRFTCDRGVSHEIVRHRLASFSQESTRYCNYAGARLGQGLTFIRPPWVNIKPGEYPIEWDESLRGFSPLNLPPEDPADSWWFWHCALAERDYLVLIDRGWTPEKARSVLPNSLKTEIVVTANVREWRHILRLRSAPAAHPQMRELMSPLLSRLRADLPEVFDDIPEPSGA
jgi:thymidylate synthase (FAD)